MVVEKSPRLERIEQLVSAIDTWETREADTYVGANKDIRVYAAPYFDGEWEAEIKVEDIASGKDIERIAGFAGLGVYLSIKQKAEKQVAEQR